MNKRELLISTIDYYGSDPKRRCTNGMPCFYSPAKAGKEEISAGCAIGRFMTPEQQTQADGRRANSVDGLPKELIPESLRRLDRGLLWIIQKLHDNDKNWTDTGLSAQGKEEVKRIGNIFRIKVPAHLTKIEG